MFSYRNDPSVDGVGVAFFDAVDPDGGRLDLTLGGSDRWRGQDWELAEEAVGVSILNAYQVHSATVLSVDQRTDPHALAVEPGDALVTTVTGLGLAVRAADCLPVLIADPQAGVIGAAHAGRVGLASGVLTACVEQLRRCGGRQFQAWIGPHICGSCYEVSPQLYADYVLDVPAAASTTSWGTPSLDLGAAAAAQLGELGCTVIRVDPCTRTTPSLHSYRRDAASSGRQAGVVWLP